MTIGRPKGRKDIATPEVKNVARNILEDPTYRETLLERARTGRLGALEVVLWNMAYGKRGRPFASEEDGGAEEILSDLTQEELAERAELVATTLRAGGKV